jgi:hypothetical protein
MSSRPRSWGTRFDALPSSPHSSTDTSPLPAHADEKTTEETKAQMLLATREDPSPQSKPRIPQEATIFVGRYSAGFFFLIIDYTQPTYYFSLPPEVDNQEISELLLDHLKRYGEAFTVKVVRDSRRLPCAFVQCQV